MDRRRMPGDPPFIVCDPETLAECLAVIDSGFCPAFNVRPSRSEEAYAAAVAFGIEWATGQAVIITVYPDAYKISPYESQP